MLSVAALTFIGVAGLLLLLVFLAFDGLFDVFGGEPVLPAAAFFAATFGFAGALAHQVGSSPLAILWVPLLVSLTATAFLFFVYRSFAKRTAADESYTPDPQDMLYKLARVNWWSEGEAGGEGHGEVILTWAGQPRRVRAVSTEPFAAAQSAYVVEVYSADSVRVASSSTPSA